MEGGFGEWGARDECGEDWGHEVPFGCGCADRVGQVPVWDVWKGCGQELDPMRGMWGMDPWEVQWDEGDAGGGPGLWMRRVCEGRLRIGWCGGAGGGAWGWPHSGVRGLVFAAWVAYWERRGVVVWSGNSGLAGLLTGVGVPLGREVR